MKKWEQFTKDELELFVKESSSYADVCEKVGYRRDGGSGTKAIREMIQFYGFDISHFPSANDSSHNKNIFDYDRFQKGKAIKSANMLNALIHLRGHKCEKCLNEIWLNLPIKLEVHHKDGDSLNNELSNLELLCPNCHATTENWRGKNINKKEEIYINDDDFAKALKSSPNIRQALLKLGLAPKGGNYKRANEIIVKYQILHLIK